jgi:hypothetical protein
MKQKSSLPCFLKYGKKTNGTDFNVVEFLPNNKVKFLYASAQLNVGSTKLTLQSLAGANGHCVSPVQK